MGSVKKNGGARPGAGRKSKAEEQKLIERLSPMEDKAIKLLSTAMDEGQSWAIKMYFEYMYGKPKETRDLNISQEVPLFSEDNPNGQT